MGERQGWFQAAAAAAAGGSPPHRPRGTVPPPAHECMLPPDAFQSGCRRISRGRVASRVEPAGHPPFIVEGQHGVRSNSITRGKLGESPQTAGAMRHGAAPHGRRQRRYRVDQPVLALPFPPSYNCPLQSCALPLLQQWGCCGPGIYKWLKDKMGLEGRAHGPRPHGGKLECVRKSPRRD